MDAYQRSDIVCGICSGTGWQALRIPVPGSAPNVFARPCACSAAPAHRRSESPFCAPNWLEDAFGVWSPNPEARIQPHYEPPYGATGKGYIVFVDTRTGKEIKR